MIAAWILYALMVGVLVGGGAMVVENLLRAHRLPTRWVWAGAMFLSVFWPLGHLLWREWPREAAPVPLPDPAWVPVLDPLAVQVAPESFLRALDGPIVLLWGLATVALVAFFGGLVLRTGRLRRSWRGAEAGGHSVLISGNLGPAVVGYIKPEIVLPTWCRELEDHTLKLILDHELEHLRAGDLRLTLTAGIIPVLLPWNLPIWWQFRRLRLAVEGDCDLRVLKKHPERTRPYMELLLQVAGQVPQARALLAMLSEPEETLARRIRIMTMPFPTKPWIRGASLAGLGAFLVAVACWAPGPTDMQGDSTTTGEASTSPDQSAAGMEMVEGNQEEPHFTPYTVRPDIRNREDIARALERDYPADLREQGISGVVSVWIKVDETGKVQAVSLGETSGHDALDEAALKVAGTMLFTPALNEDEAVTAWVSIPIAFGVKVMEEAAGETKAPAVHGDALQEPEMKDAPKPRPDPSAEPTFTPYTVRPDIRNRAEVARALEVNYPADLRDAGIGGTASIWLFIDESGLVQKVRVNESSGHKALDDAALAVASEILFTPALNREKKVAVWIALPITFSTR